MIEDWSWKAVIVLGVCIAFAAGVLSAFILIYDLGPPVVSLSQNIYGLPLSEMWTIVEDRTDVENATAVLEEFWLVTEDDGSVKSLRFNFYGVSEGRYQWYRVAVDPAGKITLDSHEIDKAPAGEHPLVLLSEIERIPYRELINEDMGLIIFVDSQSGDLGYDAGYRPLFVLNQGTIVPLERVSFSTDEPWYDIDIFTRIKDGSRGDTYYCTLFTLRDLGMAETVDYRSAGSSLRA